jgi:hypothetical protein
MHQLVKWLLILEADTALSVKRHARTSRVQHPTGPVFSFSAPRQDWLWPTQPPIKWVLKLKREKREAHLHPMPTLKCVIYLHSSYSLLFHGSQFRNRNIFSFWQYRFCTVKNFWTQLKENKRHNFMFRKQCLFTSRVAMVMYRNPTGGTNKTRVLYRYVIRFSGIRLVETCTAAFLFQLTN